VTYISDLPFHIEHPDLQVGNVPPVMNTGLGALSAMSMCASTGMSFQRQPTAGNGC
jgi:hypothetical protein